MGKLFGQRCYESGPIDCAPDYGKGWRDDLKPFFKELGVIVLDPLNKPIDLGFEEGKNLHSYLDDLLDRENYNKVCEIMKVIRRTDLRMCDVADFAVVYIDMDILMCGTIEELTTLNRSKKAILVVCKQGKKNVPRWLFGMIPHQHVFNNFEEAKDYLWEVDSGKNVEDFKRWQFFDYSKL